MRAARPTKPLDAEAIDALYGLEPVFEPGTDSSRRRHAARGDGDPVVATTARVGPGNARAERFATALGLGAGSDGRGV